MPGAGSSGRARKPPVLQYTSRARPCSRRILEDGRFSSAAARARPRHPPLGGFMVSPRPVTELGLSSTAVDARHPWLTPERLTRVRAILLGLSLFFGLAVYVFHT